MHKNYFTLLLSHPEPVRSSPYHQNYLMKIDFCYLHCTSLPSFAYPIKFFYAFITSNMACCMPAYMKINYSNSNRLGNEVARVWSCGICGGQSGAGTGFLRVLQFPLPFFIPPIAPQSPSSIIWDLYNRPEVAAVPRDLVQPHKIKKLKNLLQTEAEFSSPSPHSDQSLTPLSVLSSGALVFLPRR
jgi:hypothetical protein